MFTACSPLDPVTFLSQTWCGCVCDNPLVRSSGYRNLKYHQPGHQILADRGFTLDDDITGAHSAELINPSFTKRKQTVVDEKGGNI